jgi:general secretion pathway protein C
MNDRRWSGRFYGFVVAALLAVALHFQAAGAVALASAHALPLGGQPRASEPERRTPSGVTLPQARPVTGEPILARNAFDSTTGPLDRDPTALELSSGPRALDLSAPLSAPQCADVVVNIVSESEDPAWSLAQLKGPGDADASTRRVGDLVGQLAVAHIGFNALKESPAVWFVTQDRVCQALLFNGKGAAEGGTHVEVSSAGPRTASQVPKEIADKIQKLSDTEFIIDRSALDGVLSNQLSLTRTTRIVPEQRDGKTVGIRLFGVRPDSLLGTLGLQNGDRLEQINGHDVSSPEKALEAYAGLRSATQLSVQLTRRGQPVAIDYRFQ